MAAQESGKSSECMSQLRRASSTEALRPRIPQTTHQISGEKPAEKLWTQHLGRRGGKGIEQGSAEQLSHGRADPAHISAFDCSEVLLLRLLLLTLLLPSRTLECIPLTPRYKKNQEIERQNEQSRQEESSADG